MGLQKDLAAETMTRDAAARAGILTFTDKDQVAEVITANSRRLFGFTRKMLPKGLPEDPKIYMFSVSEYGEDVNLGPGFKIYKVYANPGHDEDGVPTQHGPACVILPINFFEEAKVDVTEHTFTSGIQIAEAILKIGPGMNASWDRRKIGWFVSATNPPNQADVDKALEVYTVECKRLLNEGNRYASNPKTLDEINETHRRAANFLKQKVDWDKQVHKMVDCVMCGEAIRATAAVHAVPYCGAVQTGRWPDAIRSGMKKLEDAPRDIQREYIKAQKALADAQTPETDN